MKRYFFGSSPRAVATFVCYVVNGSDQRARELLEHELERSQFDRRDRDLATELVYGAVRRRGTLDHLLARVSSIPLRKIQPRVLEILRIGAYQLLFLDKVPASAAVNEAVTIARRVATPKGAGFVNACLRTLARAIVAKRGEQGSDPRCAVPVGEGAWCVLDRPLLPSPTASPAKYLAAAYSHPEWLVQRWLARLGEAKTRELCDHDNTHAGVVLRVNRLRTTRDDLVAEVIRSGRWARPIGTEHVLVDQGGALDELAALRDGLCTVQGVAASAAAPLLDPQPGERVLDVCSAPGSKACQIAELAKGQAEVVALDLSPKRLKQVAENVKRLGARTVWPVAGDGASCAALFRAEFDAVLVDAPCSNTGVLSRRVESRWRITPERIRELAQLQRRLLGSAASVARPGGRLVYSTCSLEPEENELVVESLCAEQADWKVVSSRCILPSETNDDGGYVALLQRAGRGSTGG
ncbi:MAG TPA: 16S rRNA (cytosine(967)-C(5))-methyltransferase RsmB [Planctomycetota bacterium]|nr:16S rRNA (cytosine(967)-C(5))-methyltransferase RsmB [Planctomycetota bacterium]HRR80510.1 16S rRNA (cytosine(967)-C(5))-methyltransferase RsmB [Planctomycetota bacterium]HRT95783.1 16S rRNA (cytosine(967)-C(5))-methyltransferase RsmB [Planctomycetota bacterium]